MCKTVGIDKNCERLAVIIVLISLFLILISLWEMLTIDWWSEPWKDIKLFLSLLAFIVGVMLLLNALVIAYLESGCTIDIPVPWQNTYSRKTAASGAAGLEKNSSAQQHRDHHRWMAG